MEDKEQHGLSSFDRCLQGHNPTSASPTVGRLSQQHTPQASSSCRAFFHRIPVQLPAFHCLLTYLTHSHLISFLSKAKHHITSTTVVVLPSSLACFLGFLPSRVRVLPCLSKLLGFRSKKRAYGVRAGHLPALHLLLHPARLRLLLPRQAQGPGGDASRRRRADLRHAAAAARRRRWAIAGA